MRDAVKAACIFFALAAVTLGMARWSMPQQVIGKTTLRVLQKQRVGESTFLDVQTIVPPTMRFRVESGLVGEDKLLFGCLEVAETRKGPQGVLYPAIVIVCDHGLKAVMTDLDLTTEVK